MIPARRIAVLSSLTSASGLVRAGEYLYVIADDLNHLGVFFERDLSRGKLVRLFPGELPVEKKARKRVKPDLEAIALVPESLHPPHGALLLLPSGSKPNRSRGARLPLDAKGGIGEVRPLDLERLYSSLEKVLGSLNLEGAAICDDRLCLLNRGNKNSGNALITLDATTLKLDDKSVPHPISLGDCDGVPYTVTDAAPLAPGRLVFTAVAEDTGNAYDDGRCVGAGLGILDLRGTVLFFDRIEPLRKLEGVTLRRDGARLRLLLVNDEDDPARPSELLEAEIPS